MCDESDPWTYIPAAEFKAPLPPATEAARGGLRRLWKSLQCMFQQTKHKVANEVPTYDRPALDLLESIVPDPDWNQAAGHLADALGEDWFQRGQTGHRLCSYVGPPGCEIGAALHALAEQRGLRVLSAPTPESLLEASSSNASALALLDQADQVWVIPHLEAWYLRHEDGLNLIRRLLERLISTNSRALIGCDSWAWAFLQRALGIEATLGQPQTLAACEAERLDAWFRANVDLGGYEFRQSGKDEPIFPEPAAADHERVDDERADSPDQVSALIRSLAAKSRGNLSVALALWRASLRTCDTEKDVAPAKNAGSVLWVDPHATTRLDIDLDQLHRFVLHYVLLHGGLSLGLLVKLLPQPVHDLHSRVSELRQAGILAENGDQLHVTLATYPLIRRNLDSEGFLTDAF